MVKPRDGTVKEAWASPAILIKVRHLSRTSEDKLVLAVLAGHVDVTSLPLLPSMSYDFNNPILSDFLSRSHCLSPSLQEQMASFILRLSTKLAMVRGG